MKAKIFIATVLLIMASLACNTTDQTAVPPTSAPTLTSEQSVGTREANISQSLDYFSTPESWGTVPKTCHQGMVDLVFNGEFIQSIVSGNIVNKAKFVNSNGLVVNIYHIYTANHGLTSSGITLNGSVDAYYQETRYTLQLLDYTQIVDQNQSLVDIVLVSLIGLEDMGVSFPNNIISGQYLIPESGLFYSFDFPAPSLKAQFTTSTVYDTGVENGHKTANLVQTATQGAINSGSSGGAICNPEGNIVGVVKGIYANSSNMFTVELNPENVQDQISSAIARSLQIMANNGFQ